MKNIWFIALISITLGLTSCSDKDKDEDKTTFTVTFDAGGGSPVPQAQSVEKGATVTAPANPAKTGYVFMFWHLNGIETAYNFSTPVTDNVTLYAQWKEEAKVEYWQVAWELNGGAWPSSGDNHATQVVKGGTLAEPAAPTKLGYTFDGWYKEAALTNKVSFPYDVSLVTANFTLYAKWTTEGGNPSSTNHNISNAAEWNAAVAAVNAAGSNKTHTFTVTKSFSLPGVGTVTIFTKELTGIMVTVKGQGSSAPEISLSSVGYLIYLASAQQKIVMENIVLKGSTNNNAAVLGVKSGEMIIGNGAVITDNTNTAGGSGGIDVGGKLILAGGEITGNISGTTKKSGQGGGVFVDRSGEFVMESGSIGGNYVYGQGGGVQLGLYARFTMKGGEIYGNTAWAAGSGARGGGLHNTGGDFYMSGGKITGYGWVHKNDNDVDIADIDIPAHYTGFMDRRDNCNSVVITATAMSAFGAALYSPSGSNYYGTSSGETFTKTGEFGSNIHIERDIEIADGVRLNRLEVNGEIYQPYSGKMDYWGHDYNTTTENIFLGLSTIYGEFIALDMLAPVGKDRLVAGTYAFSSAALASAVAYTFVDNDYTSYVQDAKGNKFRMTGGTVKISVAGTGDNAVYTITMDCTLENGGKVKGTYRGTLKWSNRTL